MTLVFKIEPTLKGSARLTYIDSPASFNLHKKNAHLKSFLEASLPHIFKKWIDKNLFPNKKGGTYTGLRLEAHTKGKTRPTDKFAASPNLFNTHFIAATIPLNITYK